MSAVIDERQRIKDALACIPADLPRDDWARIGTALKSELG
jgi:putative DNA primase/helicase